MGFKKRKFAYAHPRFGRSKKEVAAEIYRNSVYYYWWEFLRRSDRYRKVCSKSGRGSLAALYKDFGDVFNVDFKTWWTTGDRGANLFAEIADQDLTFGLVEDPQLSTDSVLIVRVPLALPKRFLQGEFYKLLTKHHKGKRGRRTNAVSTAMYPVCGHVDIFSLDRCLKVFDLKTENPKMPLWEVGNSLKVMQRESLITPGEWHPVAVSKKNILSTVTDRYFRRAKRLIAAVERGEFPIR